MGKTVAKVSWKVLKAVLSTLNTIDRMLVMLRYIVRRQRTGVRDLNSRHVSCTESTTAGTGHVQLLIRTVSRIMDIESVVTVVLGLG